MKTERTSLPILSAHADPQVSRRTMLKLLAAQIAAIKAGCARAPGAELIPYADVAPERRAGAPEHYATALVEDGFATGLIVESHEGRPTRVDGNPLHPSSLGATTARQQASVYDLYDPRRARLVTHQGLPSSWSSVARALSDGSGGPLWIVHSPQSSPLFARGLLALRERYGSERVVPLSASSHEHAYEGSRLAFGAPLEAQLDFAPAEVVLSLDADFVAGMPMSLRWAREVAQRRKGDPMSRLYVVEPMPTCSGTMADHRLAIPGSFVVDVALGVLAELRRAGRDAPEVPASLRERSSARLRSLGAEAWVKAVAEDLRQHAGRSLVVVGDRQPPACHALGHVLNAALGNTVRMTDAILPPAEGASSLAELAAALAAKQVGSLVVIDCDPVYTGAGLSLDRLIANAARSVHFGTTYNETSRACAYQAPLAHYLESWDAARALDGTLSLTQPLVRPLHDSRCLSETLALLRGDTDANALNLLSEELELSHSISRGSREYRQALARGFVTDSAAAPREARLVSAAALEPLWTLAESAPGREAPKDSALELDLALSPTVWDGRYAENAWLEELPHPITKLTWGNALLVGTHTAKRLALEDEDIVQVRVGEASLELPVLTVAGHAERCVTLELGYGRALPVESIAHAVGSNGYALARRPGPGFALDASITPTGRKAELARSQTERHDHQRGLALALNVRAHRENPDEKTRELKGELPTLHPEARLTGHPQWAMSIDTSACTGCSACVIACQAENNVPVVGAEGVRRGREMHWLRVDSYSLQAEAGRGPATVVHQPMMCQHCEHAPCEYVCPTFATQHSPDGLNEMVYNRCIGTRFCSNNCPYKVRRFNWFHYTADQGTLALQRNPQVTVRDRGVMEKCTYCVQRIRSAEIHARMEKREIRPGEVVTACQAACPTGAIQFGALEHGESAMVQMRNDPRSYAALHELGARPRTMYLAKLTNPNPRLGGAS